MGTVSGNKYWRCPGCGEVLEKGMLEKGIVQPGQPADRIMGTGTCSGCGTGYSQSAIYGGEYDFVGEQVEEAPTDRVPTVVSLVLFREGAQPPADAQSYCERVLRGHYGREVIVRGWQLIGRLDRPTTAAIGALYSQLRDTHQIPDYGHPTDQLEVDGPDGNHVAALVFWHEFIKAASPGAVTPTAATKKRRFWQRKG